MTPWVVGFRTVPAGVELRFLGSFASVDLPTVLQACVEDGLEGFAEFSRPVDVDELVRHVRASRALIEHPAAVRLWVVDADDGEGA